MRKLLLTLLITILWISIGFAQKDVILLNSYKSSVEMTEKRYEKLSLSFNYTQIKSFTVDTKEGNFDEIIIPGAYFTGEIGTPKLPASKKLIDIPFDAEISIKILNYTVNEYNLKDYGISHKIMPVQPDVKKDEDPTDVKFEYDKGSYETKGYITPELVDVEILGIMRGVRIARLTVSPVSYNPVEDKIKVYNNIEFEIQFNNSNIAKTEYISQAAYSPFFEPVYQQLLNSKNVIDDHPDLTKYPVKMMILSDRMFETALAPYIAWKTKKGFELIVNYTDEGYSTVNEIKAWVQTHYDAGTPEDPAPSFCLFVGDVAQIPASQVGVQSGKQTDLYYFSQDGDYFPEMYYGRFSANDLPELQPIIDKTLYHEQYEFADPAYLDDVTLIAGYDSYWNTRIGQPTVQYGTQNYFNASYGFTNVNDYLDSYTGCYDNERISVSFINYTAHCNQTSWGTPNLTISDINAMTNTNKYPLAVGNCCYSADFGYSECIGEAWIRAEDKGAVAYIGSSPSSLWFEDFYWAVGAFPLQGNNDGYVPTFEETTLGVYDAMFVSDYVTVDATVFLGNLAVTEVDVQGWPQQSNPTCYWEGYNCLGDPSLVPFYTQGETNTVSHLSTLPIGMVTYEVSAEPGSYVAISKDGVLHGAALVDASGTVDVPITPITTGGDVDIVVTKPQYIPYITTVPAAALEGPYMVVDSYVNEVDYGQSVNLDIVLENVGEDDATGVSVTVTTSDANANITNETYDYGDIAAGATSSASSGAFTLTVADDLEDQYSVAVDIAITDGNKTLWEQTKNVTVNAPIPQVAFNGINDTEGDLVFTSAPVTAIDEGAAYNYNISVLVIGGNDNSMLDAGEIVGVFVNAGNAGHASFVNATCTLSSTSEYVTVNTDEYYLGTIAAGQTFTPTFSITVDESTPTGTVVDLTFTLTGGEYSETITVNLSVGLQIEDFETGDFSAYPWTMSGNADWTIDADAHGGTYSAKSGNISDNQESEISVTINVADEGELTFWYKVSSETCCDELHFYIDGIEKDNYVDGSWTEISYPVTAGVHTLKWAYEKDYSISNGSDCAWIDDITFPGHSSAKGAKAVTITAPTLPAWLSLTDNGDGTAVLSGTAPNEQGLHDVVIEAQAGGDPFPQPFTINVGGVSVDVLTGDISIFPNPNNGIFNIDLQSLSGIADVKIYNINGKEIYEFKTSSDILEVNLTNYAKGVYFVRIISGNETYNGKIILK
ncbi:MAG: T9SS type A sorting domain-containing protein [Bacteroidales bacterium]|nr:T9SS type A sorting domain-containing protein [Bacteroidales bacterium]